ncbi:molybdopterin-converting factor subunit 2 [Dinoroseobacter shibae DFL 12 = DSM 16493]|jgi:molybdopterin synthase catalytic subunit|uniref:Molybdopterin synthase catalytic subunit n=1 Tax=Dinoroseobacter shibae (strain DSM 16493 / NCIMB 14021 / DFL 12) TaxID=398580 RepID=A8LL87_DINSH|nr:MULTISPECIES: molybdenum cofactor biosynthesis protein MoaE [Dinoroseobacter]ABV94836.1 molybdopterin-converting factor subunit 2 [Dinoroseobacter shibae DFL 12 = DSM 16493]MDD9716720.1 molybdenum cofactor biosynthesis protein MoaE [Dinoroseobacter sp. PD6]URF46256.1 molybdenum cofactor biosynthesis protein MoaE [Dinoroseobacter shibae]URF50563.1 molybdenum cofactor biosynthesis protein MoaE [Dinoroseobacter shibae]
MTVRVQQAPFALGAELDSFAAGRTDMGAIVSFTGVVRDVATGDLDVMEIEHYPGMTERAIGKIVDEAKARWSLGDALVIHRYGRMGPGDRIMMVATAAPHRVDAFAAAEFLMDYLKSRAPFWKKEISGAGASWVAATDEDEAALTRW